METSSINEKPTIPHSSDIKHIYDWLLTLDLTTATTVEYDAWINMASHCYFMNEMNLGGFHAKSLQKVLHLAKLNNIEVPNIAHFKVLDMVNNLKNTEVITRISESILG